MRANGVKKTCLCVCVCDAPKEEEEEEGMPQTDHSTTLTSVWLPAVAGAPAVAALGSTTAGCWSTRHVGVGRTAVSQTRAVPSPLPVASRPVRDHEHAKTSFVWPSSGVTALSAIVVAVSFAKWKHFSRSAAAAAAAEALSLAGSALTSFASAVAAAEAAAEAAEAEEPWRGRLVGFAASGRSSSESSDALAGPTRWRSSVSLCASQMCGVSSEKPAVQRVPPSVPSSCRCVSIDW